MQWKSLVRNDPALASGTTPGKPGRPARVPSYAPSESCPGELRELRELDPNKLEGDLEYADALARIEEGKKKEAAAKEQVADARRIMDAAQQRLAAVVESNERLQQTYTAMSVQQDELAREFVVRKEYGAQL